MILPVLYAASAGIAISLSRQINGRLATHTSPLIASFWNHIVGLVALTLAALVIGRFITGSLETIPWVYYLGGPIGVIFVASGSFFVARLGAVLTSLLVISGQMVFGVTLDVILGLANISLRDMLGIGAILAGLVLANIKRG